MHLSHSLLLHRYHVIADCWDVSPAHRPKLPRLKIILDGLRKISADAQFTAGTASETTSLASSRHGYSVRMRHHPLATTDNTTGVEAKVSSEVQLTSAGETGSNYSKGHLKSIHPTDLNNLGHFHSTPLRDAHTNESTDAWARVGFPHSVSNPGDPEGLAQPYCSTPFSTAASNDVNTSTSANPFYAISRPMASGCSALTPPCHNNSMLCKGPGVAATSKDSPLPHDSCGTGNYSTAAQNGPHRWHNTSLCVDNAVPIRHPPSLGFNYEDDSSLPATPTGQQHLTNQSNISFRETPPSNSLSSSIRHSSRPSRLGPGSQQQSNEMYANADVGTSPCDAASIRSCLRTPGSSFSSCRSSVHFAGETFCGKMPTTAPSTSYRGIGGVVEGDEASTPPAVPLRDDKQKLSLASNLPSTNLISPLGGWVQRKNHVSNYPNVTIVPEKRKPSSPRVGQTSNPATASSLMPDTASDEEYTLMEPVPKQVQSEHRRSKSGTGRHGRNQLQPCTQASGQQLTVVGDESFAPQLLSGDSSLSQSQDGRSSCQRQRTVSNPVDIPYWNKWCWDISRLFGVILRPVQEVSLSCVVNFLSNFSLPLL